MTATPPVAPASDDSRVIGPTGPLPYAGRIDDHTVERDLPVPHRHCYCLLCVVEDPGRQSARVDHDGAVAGRRRRREGTAKIPAFSQFAAGPADGDTVIFAPTASVDPALLKPLMAFGFTIVFLH